MLGKDEDALDVIMDEVAELVAWSSCAGIPMLSIYEKTGILRTTNSFYTSSKLN